MLVRTGPGQTGRRDFLRLLAALGLAVLPLPARRKLRLNGGWILRADDR